MALDMSQIERIRDLRVLGYSLSEIRRETGYSYPIYGVYDSRFLPRVTLPARGFRTVCRPFRLHVR